jgi:hypothetical protein
MTHHSSLKKIIVYHKTNFLIKNFGSHTHITPQIHIFMCFVSKISFIFSFISINFILRGKK